MRDAEPEQESKLRVTRPLQVGALCSLIRARRTAEIQGLKTINLRPCNVPPSTYYRSHVMLDLLTQFDADSKCISLYIL